ncbi:CpsD/CapB family tyrosine-protein kinase [Sagittula sp. M10.9X]|uniref:CpsD/CapB family tyrosine-protein kinase n=2 Tax=Sagittula salina TaxID=2820268 RepID=A0A940S4W5_9RHOB|nr:CpsD/CapB family tyrosine-protein kinase [Sagittula salina]
MEDAQRAEDRRLAEQAQVARDARLSRAEVTRRAQPPLALRPEQRSDPWFDIPAMTVDLGHLNRHRVITADRLDPAHTTFDVLRTRLMQALADKGWKRVAITSPGKDCGKTFTTANLAISLSRQENARTLVMDFDMRRPALHKVMGVSSPGALGDVLRGNCDPEEHFLRMGQNNFSAGHNIAFALNTVAEPYASELLQDPRTKRALTHIEDAFRPDVMLFDLPPALFYDDVIAAQPLIDGVLLVIGGGLTTEREIKEVERRLGKETPLLGMVLNKAENAGLERYAY